ncbi:AAA family ATPase [Actinokineospora sp. NBRC 105648]|uniref:AAA family ATPase n=1 Tax=Actinokineospora sp. NBRC 105648 TaxID=3032206 RepID=UPI0025522DAA|nr:AAA family ATPase [Actinokineospora sp. NBRC 105648]
MDTPAELVTDLARQQLGGGAAALVAKALADRSGGGDQAPERSARVFLSAVTVAGFRGVGPSSRLALVPANGLTIVLGRNGSGKSSFAEALELALTGDTYRWSRRTKIWRENWRNVHHGESAIRAEFVEEGVGSTVVGVDWGDGAGLADRSVWVRRGDGEPEAGAGALGWARAIELYRPLLSYDEVGGLLTDGPTRLFDKIDAVLGIDRITDAQKELADEVKRLRAPVSEMTGERRELKQLLEAVDDPRAERVRAALGRRRVDTAAIRALVTGTGSGQLEDLVALRALSEAEVPPVAEVVGELRAAADVLARNAVAVADQAEARSALLRQALALHTEHGDGPCPVCGHGVLDEEWSARARAGLAAEDRDATAYRAARRRVEDAVRRATVLIASVPRPPSTPRFALPAAAAATSAWEVWATAPQDPVRLAEHLDRAGAILTAAVAELRDQAGQALAGAEDTWAPIAARVAAWCDLADRANQAERETVDADEAATFLAAQVGKLRDERVAEISGHAKTVWAALRHDGHINLGDVQLTGKGTMRRVRLGVALDGIGAEAIGVMSQGELHALTLALFLPRATRPTSPFRFLVLDDPVQAMDAATVDGFAGVLDRLAAKRQVIVLTHDDRLPNAVRTLGINANVLRVEREPGSVVTVHENQR